MWNNWFPSQTAEQKCYQLNQVSRSDVFKVVFFSLKKLTNWNPLELGPRIGKSQENHHWIWPLPWSQTGNRLQIFLPSLSWVFQLPGLRGFAALNPFNIIFHFQYHNILYQVISECLCPCLDQSCSRNCCKKFILPINVALTTLVFKSLYTFFFSTAVSMLSTFICKTLYGLRLKHAFQ